MRTLTSFIVFITFICDYTFFYSEKHMALWAMIVLFGIHSHMDELNKKFNNIDKEP